MNMLYRLLITTFCYFFYLQVNAGTIVVTNTNDAGAGSLRNAVSIANAGDIIVIDNSLIIGGNDTIKLDSVILINEGFTIKGLYNLTDTLFISGQNTSQIFKIELATASVKNMELDSLVLINGYDILGYGGAINFNGDSLEINNTIISKSRSAANNLAYGGGIYSNGFLRLKNTSVTNNRAEPSSFGATQAHGGGIYSNGDLVVLNSIINNNTVQSGINSRGGGIMAFSALTIQNSFVNGNLIDCAGGSYGGGIYADSILFIDSVEVYNNRANGANNSYGAGIYAKDVLEIKNSTISYNYLLSGNATPYGGGIYANDSLFLSKSTVNNNTVKGYSNNTEGTGIYVNLYAKLTTSTITSNISLALLSSSYGGGIFGASGADLELEKVTLVDNKADIGGGVYAPNANSFLLGSSIIAYNTNGDIIHGAMISSNGYNAFGDTLLPGSVLTDQLNIDSTSLNLGDLQNNGGVTATMMPKIGSIALNNGNPSDFNKAQNSLIIDSRRDIGAAESCVTIIFDTILSCIPYTSMSGNSIWDSTGQYKDTVFDLIGNCDSLFIVNLKVSKSYSFFLDSVCDSLVSASGKVWKTTGVFYDTLINSDGCDSILTYDLVVNNSISLIDTIIACNSYTWIDGNTYTSGNNTAKDTLISFTGCDSIISLYLTVNNTIFINDSIVACNSYTWIDGNTYTANNYSAIDTLTASTGCDSIVHLYLTINNSTTASSFISTCNSYTSPSGKIWTVSGVYNDTIVNSEGCDSLITINLTINTINDSVFINDTAIIAYESGADYQWLDCSNNYSLILGDTNQHLINASIGNYAVEITKNGCVDTSECITVTSCKAKYFPTQVIPGQVVLLDSTTGSNLKYTWYFGDGDSAVVQLPTHTYVNSGTYEVCILIEDTVDFCNDYFCDSITVDTNGVLRNSFTLSVVRNITSIEEVASNNFKLYPNPNNGSFNIDLKEAYKNIITRITDINGKLIQQTNFSNQTKLTLNFEGNRGVYFLNVSTEEGQANFRIVKN